MIKGTTKNIAKPLIGYKNLDSDVTYAPYNIDIRNASMDDDGNLVKRNGYAQEWDLSVNKAVLGLIPVGSGFAITSDGHIYKLSSSPSKLTTTIKLKANSRPRWKLHDGNIYIVNGYRMVKVSGSTITNATGSPPPNAKYIGKVGGYTLLAGYDSTEWAWSLSDNPEDWTSTGSGNDDVKRDSIIKYAEDFDDKWFVWTDKSIEVYAIRGGDSPFALLREMSIWNRGLGASYSVVQANGTQYFFSDDFRFRVINGKQTPSISRSYKKYFDDNINNASDMYGFHCEKENCIRWFSPVDGLCIRYDYVLNMITEDNYYSGGWQTLPFASYMEMNNEQYFGDRGLVGKIYKWSADSLDDNGTPIHMFRDFKVKLDEQSGKKGTVLNIRWVFKSGVATASVASPVFQYRTSFVKGKWSVWRTIDLGILGDYESHIDTGVIGTGHEMRIQIRETDAVKFILQDIFLTVKPLGT